MEKFTRLLNFYQKEEQLHNLSKSNSILSKRSSQLKNVTNKQNIPFSIFSNSLSRKKSEKILKTSISTTCWSSLFSKVNQRYSKINVRSPKQSLLNNFYRNIPNKYQQKQIIGSDSRQSKKPSSSHQLETDRILELYSAKCLDIKINFSKQQALKFLAKFKKETNSRRLHLSSSNIGYQTLSTLCELLLNDSYYYSLNLQKNEIGDQGAMQIAKLIVQNSCLTYLNIASNAIKQNGAQVIFNALRMNHSLIQLDLSSKEGLNKNIIGCGTKSLRAALMENNTLQILNLSNTSLSLKSLKYISEGLKQNTSLSALDISSNDLKQCSIPIIIQILKTHELQQLIISNNKVNNNGAKQLFQFFNLNQKLLKLKILNISNNNITSKSGYIIFDTLRRNNSLKKLYLGNNPFTYDIKIFNVFLHQNHHLEELYLQNCSFDKKICQTLSEGLKRAKAIRKIVLNGNKLQIEAAAYIFKALQCNNSLERVELKNCCIQDISIIHLGESLKKNKSIKYLNLSDNYINDTGGLALIQGLQTNKTIKQIILSSNLISYKFLAKINKKLEINKEIQINQKIPKSKNKLLQLIQSTAKDIKSNYMMQKSIEVRREKLTEQISILQQQLQSKIANIKGIQQSYLNEIKRLDNQLKQLNKITFPDQNDIINLNNNIQNIKQKISVQKKLLDKMEKEMMNQTTEKISSKNTKQIKRKNKVK